LIFKCVKSVYKFDLGTQSDEPKIELLDSSEKCKINRNGFFLQTS